MEILPDREVVLLLSRIIILEQNANYKPKGRVHIKQLPKQSSGNYRTDAGKGKPKFNQSNLLRNWVNRDQNKCACSNWSINEFIMPTYQGSNMVIEEAATVQVNSELKHAETRFRRLDSRI